MVDGRLRQSEPGVASEARNNLLISQRHPTSSAWGVMQTLSAWQMSRVAQLREWLATKQRGFTARAGPGRACYVM